MMTGAAAPSSASPASPVSRLLSTFTWRSPAMTKELALAMCCLAGTLFFLLPGLVPFSALPLYPLRRRRSRIIKSLDELMKEDNVVDFLNSYDVDPTRGFVPKDDPLEKLPQPELQQLEDIMASFSELIASGTIRRVLNLLPQFDLVPLLQDERERRRALLIYGQLCSAWVWGGGNDTAPMDRLPRQLSIPFHDLAREMQTAPILTHMSICLNNWARLDKEGPIQVNNLRLLNSFTGHPEENFFHLITVEIEAKGGAAIILLERARRLVQAIVDAEGFIRREVLTQAHEDLANYLETVARIVESMITCLSSTTRRVTPDTFYRRIRPYLAGWKSNPSLPRGVVYSGVEGSKYQHFSGSSAGQSSLLASMDMYLDLDHHTSEARASYRYLLEWRQYMPIGHHRFLDMLETDMRVNRDKGRTIRSYILGLSQEDGIEKWLRDSYSKVVDSLSRFRTTHLGIVTLYIMNQQAKLRDNEKAAGLQAAPGGKGTGGMDLANFLKPLRDHSRRKALSTQ